MPDKADGGDGGCRSDTIELPDLDGPPLCGEWPL